MGDNLRDRRQDVWHLVVSDTSCGFLFYSISGILSIPLLVLHSGCVVVCTQYKHVQYVSMRACVNGASVRERRECAGERVRRMEQDFDEAMEGAYQAKRNLGLGSGWLRVA